MRGIADGQEVIVGSPRLFAEQSIRVPADLARAVDLAEDAGRTAVLVGWARPGPRGDHRG